MNNEELKEFRKKLGLTQTGLAELFEQCSMRTVQNWERDGGRVTEYVEGILKRELERIENGLINRTIKI